MAKGGNKVVRRSSISGKFVSKQEVKRHPATTETEHRRGKPNPPKRTK